MTRLNIVSVSSGASSAVCAKRVIDRYGRENVHLVFADTLIEDTDNYRFLVDIKKFFGGAILRLSEGRSPYDLFEDENIIPNNMFAPCTIKLKTELIELYAKSLIPDFDVTMHIGFDYKDKRPRPNKPNGRLDTPIERWNKIGVEVEYPLLWQPVEYNPLKTLFEMGIEPPDMYSKGYSHANCGGMCVKQGIGDWRRTLIHYPERFAQVEAWEKKCVKNKSRRGGRHIQFCAVTGNA